MVASIWEETGDARAVQLDQCRPWDQQRLLNALPVGQVSFPATKHLLNVPRPTKWTLPLRLLLHGALGHQPS
jgi:hypothetical protein